MFFPNHLPFDFQMLRLASHIATGGSELNQLFSVAAEIPEPTPSGWYDAWHRLAQREDTSGVAAMAAGSTSSARDFFLRAANYYRVSAFYLGEERPEKRASNVESRAAFAKAQPYLDHYLLNVSIPWRGGPLPGYLLLPRQSGKTSAVVFVGGTDASKEEVYFSGARRLVDRGHAVLIFDGPGQGESLLINGHRATPDWDTLGPAFFDVLSRFPTIDLERVGLLGISMGGYYAPKIASAEHRFKCLAVWGACFDVLEDLYDFYPTIQRTLREIGGVDETTARQFWGAFNLRAASKLITGPVLITHGADDRVTNCAAAQKFAAALGDKAELRMYDGGGHCMYNMPTVAMPEIFDWIAANLH